MPAAPLPTTESQRLESLRCCAVLDTPPERAFDDLTELASRLTDMPIALVSLLDETRQWFKSKVGLNVPQTPRNQAFCGYAILGEGPLVVTDARLDDRFKDNPLVTSTPGIRSYVGVPLRLKDGHALGTLCVIDVKPRHLDQDQIETLKILADQVATHLELRRTVTDLERARRQAETACESKTAIAQNVSHEVRSPLAAMLGYIEALQQTPVGSPSALEFLSVLRGSAEHMLSVVNGVLDASKQEAQNLTLNRGPCRPARKLWVVSRMFQAQARRKGLDLRVRMLTPVPRWIESDALKIRQILINLVSNAVKFTPSGSVTLQVLMRDGRLVFQVIDTGIGLTAEQAGRLFQPFVQADASTSRTYGGTGLGLSISAGLARVLGGELTVESRPGFGATFTLTLPLDAQTSAELDYDWHIDEHEPAPAGSTQALAGRVLIVDDSPAMRRLLRWQLETAGLNVEEAPTGKAALKTLNAMGPGSGVDLVIMDLNLEAEAGNEVALEMREAGYEGPILLLSGQACPPDPAQIFTVSMLKPAPRQELLEMCARLLHPSKATQAA